MRNRQKGFSLIELLIVVAIILIIAAIAIPNLLRSKMAANEASAVGSVRTIITSEVSFSTTYGQGYAPALTNLGGTCSAAVPATYALACLIDPVLAVGTKSGYTFVATPNTGSGTALDPYTGLEINGTPLNPGTTGQRAFCADQSGVIHFNTTGAAIGVGVGTCAALPPAQVLQ